MEISKQILLISVVVSPYEMRGNTKLQRSGNVAEWVG